MNSQGLLEFLQKIISGEFQVDKNHTFCGFLSGESFVIFSKDISYIVFP